MNCGESSRNRSSSRRDGLDSTASPKDSISMRKLMDEVNFNPKTCDDIRNYIKEHNLDVSSIDHLDLKNPEHIKLLDQLYNPKILKSVLKKNHHQQQQQHKRRSGESSNSAVDSNTGSSYRHEHCSSCSRKLHSHFRSNNHSNSHHSRKSSHKYRSSHHSDYQDSHSSEKTPNRHYYERHSYPIREIKVEANTEMYKFNGDRRNFTSSPLLPKDSMYLFPSPAHHSRKDIKKEETFPDYHPESHDDRENDLFDRVNETVPRLSYGNADKYLFGSPMPAKKVKLEADHQSPMTLLDFDAHHNNDNCDNKLKDSGKKSRGNLSFGDWMSHAGDENHDPNIIVGFNMSDKKKKTVHTPFSLSKENFNPNLFFSPKPNKYESPSRYFETLETLNINSFLIDL